jgi:HAL2 family 3'(2'),5'-bisphosphate nucleotidase
MRYQRELACALTAVERAARLCRTVQTHRIDVQAIEKGDSSPVTIADLGSQALVCLELRRAFADDALIGEEDAALLRRDPGLSRMVADLVREQISSVAETEIHDAIDAAAGETDYAGRYWTLDPIDGTKGFLRGDQYAIALALVENGRVVLGVLGCPNFSPGGSGNAGGAGSLLYAVAGSGAHMIADGASVGARVHVDGITDPGRMRFCESVEEAHASHDEHGRISKALGITAEPYRIDSMAKYAAVACGAASLYLRLPRSRTYHEKIWDHAAGVIVVGEAGGTVTDFRGLELDFSTGRTLLRNEGVLVSNGAIHARALEVIRDSIEL